VTDIEVGSRGTHRAESARGHHVDVLSGVFYAFFFDKVNDFFSIDDYGLALPYLLVDFRYCFHHALPSKT
jgi:hypothetical protein